jgi:hypothetical protein
MDLNSRSSETRVNFYQTARRHVPEDSSTLISLTVRISNLT